MKKVLQGNEIRRLNFNADEILNLLVAATNELESDTIKLGASGRDGPVMFVFARGTNEVLLLDEATNYLEPDE